MLVINLIVMALYHIICYDSSPIKCNISRRQWKCVMYLSKVASHISKRWNVGCKNSSPTMIKNFGVIRLACKTRLNRSWVIHAWKKFKFLSWHLLYIERLHLHNIFYLPENVSFKIFNRHNKTFNLIGKWQFWTVYERRNNRLKHLFHKTQSYLIRIDWK